MPIVIIAETTIEKKQKNTCKTIDLLHGIKYNKIMVKELTKSNRKDLPRMAKQMKKWLSRIKEVTVTINLFIIKITIKF